MKAVVVTHSSTFEPRAEAVGKWLQAQGAEVTYVFSDFNHVKKVSMNRREKDHVYLHLKPYHKNLSVQRLLNIQAFADEVEKYLAGKQIDLLYVLLPANSLARTASRLKTACGAKVVFDIVDLWPESLPIDHVQKLPPMHMWAARRDKYLPSADLIFTECGLYRKMLDLPQERTHTLYWVKESGAAAEGTEVAGEARDSEAGEGAEPRGGEAGEGAQDGGMAAERAEDTDEILTIAYVGSINYLIDLEHVRVLLEALTARTKVCVHVIGEGETHGTFLDTIRESGAEAVDHGAVYDENEKAEIFAACHFGLNFMVPQVKVGLTIKSLDYLANSLPLLNNIPGDTWDLVEEYDAGINVPRGEEETQAERIIVMAQDAMAGRDAARLYREKFSEEKFRERLEKNLAPLLGIPAGGEEGTPEKAREAKRVSVAMAAYNGEAYIREQLDSILPQLSEEDEVVISVDPSDDKTFTLVCEAASEDDRIRVVEGPGKGVARNFEAALRQCCGRMIFLSDQDDVWLPGKVEKILGLLEKDTLVLHDAKIVGPDLEEIAPSFMQWRRSRKGKLANIRRNSYNGCCMAFRRELLDVALPFPENIPMHDQWLGLMAEKHGSVRLLRTPLLLYRRHAGNATEDHHAGMAQMLKWRTALVREMARR